MRAIKLQTNIERDHTLHLELPSDLAEGPAEVIVLVPDRTGRRKKPSVVRETRPETSEEILPLDEDVELPDMAATAAEINDLYGQIRNLVAQRSGDPGLQEAVHPLRQRLRKLQEQEADVMELRFRRQILFDPRKGRELIEQAQRILGKK
jgi:hypothetical protein